MAGSQTQADVISIRPLTESADLAEAVRLQREIWGFHDLELLPVRLFSVASKVGGQVLGAFDASSMVGFLLAIPGLRTGGESYLHSNMMGILPEYRDRHIGRALKLFQREEALARGIGLVEWTFDPLELKNAFFNIERLGAVIRRYVLNQYGTTSSPLHGGLPTDRCIAEWHLDSEWTRRTLEGRKPSVVPAFRIPVPSDIGVLRKSKPAQAREIQQRVSDSFLECFSRDLAVTGFERGVTESSYLLGPWPSK